MNKYIALVLVLCMCACTSKKPLPAPEKPKGASPLAFEAVDVTTIQGWQEDSLVPAFATFLKSIPKIKKRPHWKAVCDSAAAINPQDERAVRQFFERNFQAYAITDLQGSNTGPITGYYEPLLRGSRKQTDLYKYPVYTRPADLVTVNLSKIYPDLKQHRLRGRVDRGRVVPYYTRREIDGITKPLKGNELFWVESKIELYFLHVQGSGRIQLPSGKVVKVGYNNQNGYPYTSIGKLLVTLGHINADDISMQSIYKWFTLHPDKFEEICHVNDRYNFFMEMEENLGGPLGSLNVPLTPQRSVAVDRTHIELGTPVFLSTKYPDTKAPFRHLMMAQDTGAAIVGRIRADLFWGFGESAQHRAGIMKEEGRIWVLLPHGVEPGKGDLP